MQEGVSKESLAKIIDHTLLKPTSTKEQIESLCKGAKEFGFVAVCIPPTFVSICKEILNGTDIEIATVIGFPLGYNTTESKVSETLKAKSDGATEFDMVINRSHVKDGEYEKVKHDIESVVKAAGDGCVKVIIEECDLTKDEIVKVSQITCDSGAHFVKTSTGFGSHGATLETVKLIRETVGPNMGIKAAGGIGNTQDALKMIEANGGISNFRIGASKGKEILSNLV